MFDIQTTKNFKISPISRKLVFRVDPPYLNPDKTDTFPGR